MKALFLLLALASGVSCANKTSNKAISYGHDLTNYNYPFKVNYFNFETQNQKLTMAYGDLNSGSKKTVVLLHGKNFMGFYWNNIAKYLVKKGYRVIIPDQIGFGKSSKPKNYQYNFSQLSINTLSLLDRLSINKFSVIGHSMGGMLATHLSYGNDRVNKLVLINPIGLEDYTKYVQYKDPQFFYKNELNKTKEKIISYQKKHYYDGKWRAKYEKLIEPHIGWINGPDHARVAWNNALLYSPIFTEEVVSKLKNIKKPVHLIVGTRDRTAPGNAWKIKGVNYKMGQYQKLGKAIYNSNKTYITLYELKNLGHMPQFEDFHKFMTVFSKIF